MSIKLRVGPENPNEQEENTTPENGWVVMWRSLGWIIFVLCCTAYCCRQELVEIMK